MIVIRQIGRLVALDWAETEKRERQKERERTIEGKKVEEREGMSMDGN